MPEMRFVIRWPDGVVESCYSPSLVIKEFFAPGESSRSPILSNAAAPLCTSPASAWRRSMATPATRAVAQLAQIEAVAKTFVDSPEARVAVESFAT